MKSLLNKINFRLIVVHFIACWLFIHAFQIFSYLSDIEILEVSHEGSAKELDNLLKVNQQTNIARISYYIIYYMLAPLVGLLAAFFISIIMSVKKNWFWPNSLLAPTAAYLLIYFDSSGWSFIKKMLFFQVRITSEVVFTYILNGSVLLLLGLFLLFSKKAILFIEKGKNNPSIRG